MAHPTWSIQRSIESQNAERSQKRSQASSGTIQGKTANNAPSFAELMSEGMSGGGSSRQTRPMVARLPENQGTLALKNPLLAGRNPGDLIRAQNLGKAQADLAQSKALDSFMQGSANSPLESARSLGLARNLRSSTPAMGKIGENKGFALTANDYIRTSLSVSRSAKSQRSKNPDPAEQVALGKLSARFESGGDGIAAIGYDRTGGTSYGKYQIASRVGSMNSFLSFLDSEAPDIAARLRKAGPANTGSRQGAMPDAWRSIAKEEPERFEALQESFIRKSHYQPALKAIAERTGLELENISPAMSEVIWSTAVQHGPAGAARIFDRADDLSGKPDDPSYERKLISNVYKIRANQFGSSTSQVQAAVRNRFRQEQQLALNMLDAGGTSRATLA